MDYKSSLNLPKTVFPMKAELPKKEPELLKNWVDIDLYYLILKKSQHRKRYILHDGPPYANGDIHIGHALNKTLKDIIIKYKTMQGAGCAYVPGWDCHGLPVEHQLFKELKINKEQISQLDFRKKAYDYALRYVSLQKEQFKRLGVFADWERPYLTLAPDYEEAIVRSLGILAGKGYIYRGLKPVNWCFKCETALAEAEVEYEDHVSPSIFVKFRLGQAKDYAPDSFLVIWTTTPWTLIANVAVAVHPDFIYSYVNTEKGRLILANNLLADALAKMGIEKYELIREIKGSDLEGLVYEHPFGLRNGRVVCADYVSIDEGTGLVHTAPGHGNEDYFTGVKYKLDIIMPVDAKGNFDSSAGDLAGLNVFDANKIILEKLQVQGALLFSSKIQHSYPFCWRCKNPIIFRATKQWFLAIDKDGLRKKLLDVIDGSIEWIPASGRERISGMVKLRPDWCLSRQRYWGVPIPSLICNNCHEEILEPPVIERFAEFVSKEGSDSWFSRQTSDFLPEGFICPYCKGNSFSKGADILDVWFDSGVSHQAVLKKRRELEFPAMLYLEGSDQHRGWFQSSLITAMCIEGETPFKIVLTHGFVVDGQGRKMSKSQGNVISPQEIIKNYGADILRLWAASSDYNEDIRISPEILSRLSEAYRKIRNTIRFILSNLYDFNPDTDKLGYEDLKQVDKWILFCLEQSLAAPVENAYDDFEFYKAYKAIYDFCNEKLSMYYLDMVKGRLYTSKADSRERRAVQSVIYEVLNALVRVMSPILVFTADEVWQHMPKEEKYRSIPSVHLLGWPENKIGFWEGRADEMANFDSTVIKLIPDAAKVLEEKRVLGLIGSSFDAKINILTNNEIRYNYLAGLKDELCEIFKVSQVEVKIGKADEIEVSKAEGVKCQRCWNYSLSVGEDENNPMICGNCVRAIGGEQIEKET
ncbi:MAG: isoleucine--tRNA ligase [Candidatus Omnitrophota bacterium]